MDIIDVYYYYLVIKQISTVPYNLLLLMHEQRKLQVWISCTKMYYCCNLKEAFNKREEESIVKTRDACEKVARDAAELVAKEHALQMDKHKQRYGHDHDHIND